jgi:hypothetical protein
MSVGEAEQDKAVEVEETQNTTEVVETDVAEDIQDQEPQQEPEGDIDQSVEDEPSEPAEASEDAGPEWIDDDVREFANSYGIEDDELKSFESATDFQRACRLLDRTMTRTLAAAKKDETDTEEKGPEPKEEAAAEEEDLSLDPSAYEGYDDETIRVVKAAKKLQEENKSIRDELANMSKQVREEFDRIHRDRQEALHAMELSRFHDSLDKMDENLFGGDKPLTEEADARRKAVWDAYQMIVKAQGNVTTNRPSMEVLVKRAAMLAHGDEMIEAERKRIVQDINRQSRGARKAPGRTKVVANPPTKEEAETIHEAAQRIANSPEIVSVFDKYTDENGSVPQ